MENLKRPILEVLKDAWSNGPQGTDWLVYTVAGILLYKAVRYVIHILTSN